MNKKLSLLLSILGMSFISSSYADTTRNHMLITNFSANATISSTCTISATNMRFGQYQAKVSSQIITATSTINVLCNHNVPYYMNTYKSGNSFALYGNNEKNVLYYDLYTVTWDNQTNYQSSYIGTGSGVSQAITMYGTIVYGLSETNKNFTPIPDNYSGHVITNLDF